ncbi:MAG: hypothetical protein ACI4P4_17555 [Faecousia sp.]
MMRVEDFLLPGESMAIPARELCRVAGLENTRSLRVAIEQERIDGALILASDRGYFLPAIEPDVARSELRAFLRRQDKRLASNRRAVKAVRRALLELDKAAAGQMNLEE